MADPDPGSEKIRYGSRTNFDTFLDPGKNYIDPDPGKKGFSTRKIFKILFKKRSYPMFYVFTVYTGNT